MTYEKKAMTAFAQAALAASDLIMNKFASTKFAGQVPRVVVVEAPQMESTGGGKQARESIVLRPESGDASGSITCGFLDIGLRSCELRSYGTLAVLQKQRFQTTLDLQQTEYEKFLAELIAMLEGEGFVIKVVEPDEQKAKAQAAGNAPEKPANMGLMIGIGAVAALIVVAVVVLLILK